MAATHISAAAPANRLGFARTMCGQFPTTLKLVEAGVLTPTHARKLVELTPTSTARRRGGVAAGRMLHGMRATVLVTVPVTVLSGDGLQPTACGGALPSPYAVRLAGRTPC